MNTEDIFIRSGLEVTAFVRDESKVPPNIKDSVKVSVGDVTNPEQVSKAISGKDGVVVVLGTRNDLGKMFFSTLYAYLDIIRTNIFTLSTFSQEQRLYFPRV